MQSTVLPFLEELFLMIKIISQKILLNYTRGIIQSLQKNQLLGAFIFCISQNLNKRFI